MLWQRGIDIHTTDGFSLLAVNPMVSVEREVFQVAHHIAVARFWIDKGIARFWMEPMIVECYLVVSYYISAVFASIHFHAIDISIRSGFNIGVDGPCLFVVGIVVGRFLALQGWCFALGVGVILNYFWHQRVLVVQNQCGTVFQAESAQWK